MPTPSEQDSRSTTSDDVAISSLNAFTTCPPDDEREYLVRREATIAGRDPTTSSAGAESSGIVSSEHGHARVIGQQPAPDSDIETGRIERTPSPSGRGKGVHMEDAAMLADPASPMIGSSDTASDSDSRLAHSMHGAAITPPASATPPPQQYLHFPELDMGRTTTPVSISSFLRPGSKFKGTQQSDRQVYEVQVELKDVNLAESFLCGYLRIQGLTDDHPTLTTFFEGEIVGPKYLFKTQHPTWGSNEKVDFQHWARFPAWRPLAKSAKSPSFTLKNNLDREHLFMRWKEYFLVPDHRVKTITGASFEGFYYICFNQCSGSVSGIYFHAKSEKYQRLELQHVDEMGCMPAMEFR